MGLTAMAADKWRKRYQDLDLEDMHDKITPGRAFHMARARALFEHQRLAVVPYPAPMGWRAAVGPCKRRWGGH